MAFTKNYSYSHQSQMYKKKQEDNIGNIVGPESCTVFSHCETVNLGHVLEFHCLI